MLSPITTQDSPLPAVTWQKDSITIKGWKTTTKVKNYPQFLVSSTKCSD